LPLNIFLRTPYMPSKVPSFSNIRPKAKCCSFHMERQSTVGILGQKLSGKSSFLTSGNAYAIALAIQYFWFCYVIRSPVLVGCVNITAQVSFAVGFNIPVWRPLCENSELKISLEVVAEKCLFVLNVVSCWTLSFQSKLLYIIVNWLQLCDAVALILIYKEVIIMLHCKAQDASLPTLYIKYFKYTLCL